MKSWGLCEHVFSKTLLIKNMVSYMGLTKIIFCSWSKTEPGFMIIVTVEYQSCP